MEVSIGPTGAATNTKGLLMKRKECFVNEGKGLFVECLPSQTAPAASFLKLLFKLGKDGEKNKPGVPFALC